MLKRVRAELETADEKRIQIWKQFGTPNEDGSIQAPTDADKAKEMAAALKSLTESEIETDFHPLKASELAAAKVTISPADIEAFGELLDWDIKE